MASIKGYKYNTENESIIAQKACNDYYGIPKSPNVVTKNWCSVNYDISGFWYIVYDESLTPILGQPIEFKISNAQ